MKMPRKMGNQNDSREKAKVKFLDFLGTLTLVGLRKKVSNKLIEIKKKL